MGDQLLEAVEKLGSTISPLVEKMDSVITKIDEDKMVDWDAKIEKAFRSQFEKPETEVISNEEAKAAGKSFGYYHARKAVAQGNKSTSPMWDDRTEGRFDDYVRMVAEKDFGAIRKAFGDNPYTETTSAGGYLVPEEFRPELIRLTYLQSLALQKARIIPMSTDNLKIPTVSTGYTASWGSINTQITDSKVTLGQVDLSAEKIVGLSLVPNELLADSAIPVAQMVASEWAEAFAKLIDEEYFDGDSSDTANHEFDGWLHASSVEEVQPSTGDDTPTAAELITEANLLSMVGKLDAREMAGAEWFMHPTAWAVVRALQDGASSSIVRLNEEYMYNLLGFPVNLSNQMPSVSSLTNGSSYLAFGNPRNIIIGDRQQFTVSASTDSRHSYDQTEFRGTQRLAIAAALPGSLVKLTAPATA